VNTYDLQSRSAIVTGGARGIGYAIAERLLQSGARVAIWDIDGAAAARAASALSAYGPVTAHELDLCDYSAVAQTAQAVTTAHGPASVLVNCAGIAGPSMPLWEYPLDAWKRVVDINLTGLFHACRAVIPTMRAQGRGHIVNIASVAGKEGNPNMSAYSSSKAAVMALTKSLGKELARENIFVNSVTPATADTEILKQFSTEQMQANLAKVPMGRVVDPKEIAAMVVWLCSDECSFSTAATFDLSGGRCTY
jgi:3-oxoacyl-[acyl-carrier protein] reductase